MAYFTGKLPLTCGYFTLEYAAPKVSTTASPDSIRLFVAAEDCYASPTVAGGTTMTRKQTEKRSESKHAQSHAEMLEAALARPGVRELMKVYGEPVGESPRPT